MDNAAKGIAVGTIGGTLIWIVILVALYLVW